jgi:hypothetical protein
MSVALTGSNNQAAILSRAIDHDRELTPDVARFLLAIELTKEDADRLNELAAKARDGSLSADEESELEEYRRVGRLLEMLRLKARMALK